MDIRSLNDLPLNSDSQYNKAILFHKKHNLPSKRSESNNVTEIALATLARNAQSLEEDGSY